MVFEQKQWHMERRWNGIFKGHLWYSGRGGGENVSEIKQVQTSHTGWLLLFTLGKHFYG